MDQSNPVPNNDIPASTEEDGQRHEGIHINVSHRPIISRPEIAGKHEDDSDKPPTDLLAEPKSTDPNRPSNKANTVRREENNQPETKSPPSPFKGAKPEVADKASLGNTHDGQSPANKVTEPTKEDVGQDQKIQEYIKNRKFNVPISSSAQKKSINVSVGLTVLVLILSLILIDMMLDSGVILLVQKLPHTHFFTIGK